jgi:hypothetical protein
MSSCKVSILAAAALAAAALTAPGPTDATTLVLDSGTAIKQELFRSDGASASTWEALTFSFAIPDGASGDGVFRMFAGGDLNNITVDLIAVTAGAGTALGIFAFPADINNLSLCETAPAPAGCPIPETVPGGLYFDPTRGPAVGDIEGRRDVTLLSPGIAGLVVPQSLLVGGTSLTFSLVPRDAIFDLYIDRLELSFTSPIPEPSTWLFLSLGLGGLMARAAARSPGACRSRSSA